MILRGAHESQVQLTAKEFATRLRAAADAIDSPVRIHGPAPAPVAKLKGLYRYHFRLSAPEVGPIHALWKQVAPEVHKPGDVEFVVDVDPVNLR